MATVRDLITNAMREAGIIAINETPSAAEANDAFTALNEMLGTWQTESLIVYAKNQEIFTYPLTGQQTYTIGPTGDLVTSRPIRIDAAYNRDPNDNDYQIYVAKDFSDYSDLITKNVTANLVTLIYYDPTMPNGTLYMWPTPNTNTYRLVLWTWTSVTEFATLDDVIELPPGYLRAIRSNLATELAPRYGREISPKLQEIATTSKAQIKRTNMTIATLIYDTGMSQNGLNFNYLTGQPT